MSKSNLKNINDLNTYKLPSLFFTNGLYNNMLLRLKKSVMWWLHSKTHKNVFFCTDTYRANKYVYLFFYTNTYIISKKTNFLKKTFFFEKVNWNKKIFKKFSYLKYFNLTWKKEKKKIFSWRPKHRQLWKFQILPFTVKQKYSLNEFFFFQKISIHL